ncbi:hypothetical protein ATANTOWER_025546 [Ataeniobius toweri]|uniref:Transposase n=1 Tax=Ataeniobius toweri TaxID=208326 RepID=A0ABU7AJA2_9TELE|nr:hypothetical protein [Ataeniobius toweri]
MLGIETHLKNVKQYVHMIHYTAKSIGSHHQINEFWCSSHFHGCRYIKVGVEKLDWPAESPVLHLLEHLWDELEQRLQFWFSFNIRFGISLWDTPPAPVPQKLYYITPVLTGRRK